jgi:hypothetical protein
MKGRIGIIIQREKENRVGREGGRIERGVVRGEGWVKGRMVEED